MGEKKRTGSSKKTVETKKFPTDEMQIEREISEGGDTAANKKQFYSGNKKTPEQQKKEQRERAS